MHKEILFMLSSPGSVQVDSGFCHAEVSTIRVFLEACNSTVCCYFFK